MGSNGSAEHVLLWGSNLPLLGGGWGCSSCSGGLLTQLSGLSSGMCVVFYRGDADADRARVVAAFGAAVSTASGSERFSLECLSFR